ncbi:DNA topoisomerase (ATP-hydrolyzing) subunit B [Arthrobacter sp. FW306-05-C]|uniref:DNA topoisomerase (ATP-hydrolyzing) subunit B n=1 Tax=Arthrobacter TaxID=1663 RepID=UPI00235160CE|nr:MULTISPECIES: DNA topoisomerase (ATP-hydrolyzing) subunit B [Arthrobacter]MDP9985781.1 DNA gyrase subunit B [Arthrobacter oryzae]UKA66875.1 DNA topoisomerase (ATP-hydrolyzing) subunit B [Arthrobacter sp. FW306-05-C]UKA71190.1 DNA topoisomerase (ATP-hydrolyzing) subunit B [Arthrobacter sp. FW306-06-A]UKA75510.1 DNA topoisomerase (ATP-hydrolyzing) subunit B [Arthrobacter sp. FW306-07-I]
MANDNTDILAADTAVEDGRTPDTPPAAATPREYGASDITVLEGLEAVRKRPGMYIGSTGPRGLHHLVYEVVDNSVDEALAGYCSHIEVVLQADGGVKVVDDGRGIPVDMHPTEHKPTVEVVMTILHAGGKFGGGGYAVSGGLHGVGISVVNALSSRVDTEVRRQGHVWRMSFADGGKPQGSLVKGEETDATGTSQTFYPDPTIFESTEFDFETLRARFQQMAFLNKGLRITLTDERESASSDADGDLDLDDLSTEGEVSAEHRTVVYQYDEGLLDYVKHLNSGKKVEVVHEDVIAFETEDTERKIALEMAMQWTSAYSESVHTYANTINTHEGGTHEEGFRAALTSLINRYAREKGIIKEKDDNLTGDDIREGLTAVISVKLAEPQFEGQTKTKLGNSEVKGFVQRVVTDGLGDWLERNPGPARDVIRKAISAAQARMAARKARDNARRKSPLESFGMPGKLSDCSSKDPEKCEVYIVEGDSAGGSAKRGRNPETQAILPLRGKILNVERARLDKALGNAEVQSMITAFGTGIGEDFDLAKLRYHKIVLMADADVDGQHITTLLMTLLFRYMRPLIENGYVYLAQPPLYRIKWSNAPHDYVYSDRERDAKLVAGQAAGRRIPKDNGIQRYKGLGEMDYTELWDTTMDPDHRTLLQVTMDDALAADQIFSVLMGEDVESRRNFIQQNAKDVRFLDI